MYDSMGAPQMISVLNFKRFTRGSLMGFFTLRYRGLSIQNCKLMAGSNGGPAWFSFPQIKNEQDGETKYFDILHLSNPEREAVRALILAELQQQRHLDRPKSEPKAKSQRNGGQRSTQHQIPEGENLDEYYTPPGDDIPY